MRYALLLLLTGCVGSVSDLGSQSSVDAPLQQQTPVVDAAPTPDAPSLCEPLVTTPIPGTDGHHNASLDCQGGCHDHGFTVSGTLYADPAGQTAMIGAHITVTDMMGKKVDMVTQPAGAGGGAGNFYTTEVLVFPVTVRASGCPNHSDMSGSIVAKSGCNANGCHTPNVGQGVIHLP